MAIKMVQDCRVKHQVLPYSKHGYGRRMATAAAILQLIIIMEDAENQRTPIYLSSWDIKKAFDSSSYNVLTLAWHRLGVPWAVAIWDIK